MLKNYLRLAFRHFARRKLFSVINLLGLTIGLTSCILIGIYIADESSFDNFHQNKDRIARVTANYSRGTNFSPQSVAVTGNRVGPRLKQIFPDVEDYVRTIIMPVNFSVGTSNFRENQVLYTDSSFFRIFTYTFVKGEPTALNAPDNIILTEGAALKYFGTTDIIGKTLKVNDTRLYRVAAVIKNVRDNAQLHFDFVVNFSNWSNSTVDSWFNANVITYLLLKQNNTAAPDLEQKINQYMNTPQIRQEAELTGPDILNYHLEPLTSVHLHSKEEGFEPNGSIESIYVLAAIAFLILLIACVNYTNLTIAQSVTRTGEIGIRKVLGARRSQLFSQFTGESMLLTLAALVLSLLLAIQLLPLYNSLSGKHFDYTRLLNAPTLLIIAAIGLLIGGIAGFYPAMVLSGARIIAILRSGFRVTGGKAGLRRSLVVVQFTISSALIITTVIILQQMNYIRNKDLGFDRDHVLVVPIDYRKMAHYNTLKTAVTQLPGVRNVSGAYNLPTSATWGDGVTADNEHGKISISITVIPSDLNFVKTMNMQLLAGTDFTNADMIAQNDTSANATHEHFLLNETAVRKLGWTPQEAVGKRVSREQPGIVKGVVRDFNFASIHQPIGPLMIMLDSGYVRYMLVRLGGANLPQEIAGIQGIWKQMIPDRVFDYRFLDDDYNRLYESEQKMAKIFTIFSSLAILLAILGLFGLAAITTVQRTKEIGIRRVLGADLSQIALLLARSFLVLIGIAIGISIPLAWIISAKWLNSFTYRIAMPLWAFPLAGIAVIGIAFITIAYHAVKAGRINPASVLKD